jgi:uncharacterized protein (DUF885 family)
MTVNRREIIQKSLLVSLGFGQPAWSQTAQPQSAASNFDTWAEAFAAAWMRQSPEWATGTQYFSGAEQQALDSLLSPRTASFRAQGRQRAQVGLAQLLQFDPQALSASQRNDAATLAWALQQVLAAEPFDDHGYAFNQLNGVHVGLVNFLTETHPMRRAADVASYLDRLAQLGSCLLDAVIGTEVAAQKGFLPPRFILERARAQVQALLKPAPADHVLVEALARRSARIAALPADERDSAIQRATALVAKSVQPALQRVLAQMDRLHPRTTDDAGLWRLPSGAGAYAAALASHTGTQLTPDAIHTIGLREVARIEAQMGTVLRELGRPTGSVQARMDSLRLELQPPAGTDPVPLLLKRYADYVQDSQRRSQALFNLQPKAPVEVRRVPELTERTASAYYTPPAADGSRPGAFWVPLPGPVFDLLKMRSLAVHEAVPGHHFQLALQLEQISLPRWRQRRIFGGGSANSEGWALYAERLALDNGWYEGDRHSLLGALDAHLFRARRLVVDTGLHAMRWTRQQAIEYGIPVSEVERYVSNPGQACSYMIGMLHILGLRDEAQAQLGARFDIKAFHDVVLQAGSVPLSVLSQVVKRWATGAA